MIQNFNPEELAIINRFITEVFDLMHSDLRTRDQPTMLPLEIHRNVEHYETIVFHRIPKQFGESLPETENQTSEGYNEPDRSPGAIQ